MGLRWFSTRSITMISFDATAHSNTGGATSLTYSHTCTGASILWVGFRTGTSSDTATGVTYNGVAMTQAAKRSGPAGSHYVYLYYLVNPTAGANNIVISLSGSASIIAASASYKDAGTLDATNSNVAEPGTSISTATTVVGSNCWTISFVANDGTLAMTGSTGVGTVRDDGSFASNIISLGDSNAVVSPGSNTMTWTSSSQNLAMVMASFTASDNGGLLLFM